MTGKPLRADMRQLLERLLAASRGTANALAETQQRINDQRCSCHTNRRQPRIEVKEESELTQHCEGLAGEIANRLRDRLLHLAHIVVDARHELPRRALSEEAGRLSKDVLVESVPQIHDDALPDVGHQ